MVNGLYTATNGMRILTDKVDAVSNNLANGNTTGFKKSMLVSMAEVKNTRNDEYLLHHDEKQKIVENHIDMSQGPMLTTEDPFDLALNGEGYFAVETSEGERYTRSGSFSLNPMGELVTLSGNRVLDKSGSPIFLQGKIMSVNEKGHKMQPSGQGTFKPLNENAQFSFATKTQVKQGYLEGSNVNTVQSMVEMIRYHRNFESNQKAAAAIDDTLGKAVNDIGNVN